ncbi:hypothetical protein [Halocatena salina]|uniref:Uncharacterized protein n=1 Tax=Halocatena salina TaxID=2934340 RepID=A0A8U0A879_9EURY|nr:hypothetical protein [Halocatena salina]UPM45322.1 hypothetical protein MW046_18805 [Halocatena salina]
MRIDCLLNAAEDLLTPTARDGDVPAYDAAGGSGQPFDTLADELALRTMRRLHEATDG